MLPSNGKTQNWDFDNCFFSQGKSGNLQTTQLIRESSGDFMEKVKISDMF
jgi:hypothetical protein